MKRLQFAYDMRIEYSIPVSRCHFTIKCYPQDTLRQKIGNVEIGLGPADGYRMGYDGLLNRTIYGCNEQLHSCFYFRITGTAHTGLAACEKMENENLSMIFRHPHGLNVPGECIRSFYEKVRPDPSRAPLERAVQLMDCLYESFVYRTGSTGIHTSAEEALQQGCGVCQDYAHILIALLHLDGIAARYVTGLLIGEGESHAWVEILQDHKWYGLDPTNRVLVGDDHIRIGTGRDAQDCTINRGIMHGGGAHTQVVRVRVQEVE